jgi:hypothetical protein
MASHVTHGHHKAHDQCHRHCRIGVLKLSGPTTTRCKSLLLVEAGTYRQECYSNVPASTTTLKIFYILKQRKYNLVDFLAPLSLSLSWKMLTHAKTARERPSQRSSAHPWTRTSAGQQTSYRRTLAHMSEGPSIDQPDTHRSPVGGD